MLKSAWTWIVGSLATVLMLARALAFRVVRLKGQQAAVLFDMIQATRAKFVLEEELAEHGLPRTYLCFCWVGGTPALVRFEERLLRAGHQGTDVIVYVTMPRLLGRRLIEAVTARPVEDKVPIYILQTWEAEKIGELVVPEHVPPPYMEEGLYADAEDDVAEVSAGRMQKTGILLYGGPGNGKSFLARYLALKYKLPIYIFSLTKETDNHRLIRMFSHVRGPGIVLMEDMDSYWDGRKCLLKDATCTFDTLLNIMDGLFSTPDRLVFFATANDVDKIDPALKHRPSRIKHVRHVGCPGDEVRRRIMGSAAERLRGASLDRILFVRGLLDSGKSLEEALSEADLNVRSAS